MCMFVCVCAKRKSFPVGCSCYVQCYLWYWSKCFLHQLFYFKNLPSSSSGLSYIMSYIKQMRANFTQQRSALALALEEKLTQSPQDKQFSPAGDFTPANWNEMMVTVVTPSYFPSVMYLLDEPCCFFYIVLYLPHPFLGDPRGRNPLWRRQDRQRGVGMKECQSGQG